MSAEIMAGRVEGFVKERKGRCRGEGFSQVVIEAFLVVGDKAILL